MMTARAFAGQLAIWRDLAPGLEQFTRWTNRKALRPAGTRVWSTSVREQNSLVAEAAFEAVARGSRVDDLAAERAKATLEGLPRGVSRTSVLSESQRLEAERLADNIVKFLESRPPGEVVFRPRFPGCGAVLPSEGDLLIDGELVEVKAVLRGFRASDFRQALTYCALGYAVGIQLERLTLLNPRHAFYASFVGTEFALDVGAPSWVELLQDTVVSMSGFDVSP